MTKLVVDKNLSTIQLNLNLPKAELEAYLSKIKDNYDNDNSIIKSPLELLEEELNINSEHVKNMDSFEWADTFYIYDYFIYNYLKNGKPNKTHIKNTIQEELNNYHIVLKEETEKIDLNNTNNIMKRYSKVHNNKHHLGVEIIQRRFEILEKLIKKNRYNIFITKKLSTSLSTQ